MAFIGNDTGGHCEKEHVHKSHLGLSADPNQFILGCKLWSMVSLLAIHDAVRRLRGGSEAEEKQSGHSKTSFCTFLVDLAGRTE